MKIGKVIYNGVSSDTLGVFVSGKGTFDPAELDTTSYQIPGRNGDLILQNNRYKNIKVKYPAFIPNDFENRVQSVRNWLRSSKIYARLEDNYDTAHFRMGLGRNVTFSPAFLNMGANASFEFDCKPQRFLKTGEDPFDVGVWGDTTEESGSIVDFEAEADTGIKKASVAMLPQQTGTPWIDSTPVTEPYITKTYSGGGNRLTESIIGATVAWNQLCNSSSVTVPNGHKYYLSQGGTKTIGQSSGSAITGLTSGTDMVIDLTAMFGPTIADYIYTLESGTAGAGVAWFRNLFPNDYYAYDPGSLQSVNVSAHITKDANDTVVGNYALDSDLILRGLFKLDANNNLYADGDVYPFSGSVSRGWDVVDLGSLEWEYRTSYEGRNYFGAHFTAGKYGVGQNGNRNGLCSGSYDVVGQLSVNDMPNKSVQYGRQYATNVEIGIIDDSYSDAATFTSAVTGTYLLFEKSTPTTESADPFTASQEVVSGGTEEYTDYSVAQGTRDVAVPVGHSTIYSLSVPITGYTQAKVMRTGRNLTSVSSGTNIVVGKALQGKTYTFSVTVTGNDVGINIRKNTQDGDVVVTKTLTAPRDSVTFTADEDFDIFVNGFSGFSSRASEFQLEIGSPASPYEAYNGTTHTVTWTEIAKNKFSSSLESGSIGKTMGDNASSSSKLRTTHYISVESSTEYTLSYGGGASCCAWFYDANNTFISPYSGSKSSPYTFTTPATAKFVRFRFETPTAPTDIQLETGSSATAYQPYSDSNGVVYSGTVDAVSGVLTVDKMKVIFPAIGWSTQSTNTNTVRISFNIASMESAGDAVVADIMCGQYPVVADISDTPHCMHRYASIHLWVDKQVATGASTFQNYLKSLSEADRPYVVVPLATPLTYQLTLQQVQTILGQNYLWSDSGDITVEYGADPNKLLNPTQYDARPVIKVTNPTQGGTITANGTTLTCLTAYTGEVIIDCEAMNIYSGANNLNSYFSGDFPVLSGGVNAVSFTGADSVEIIPRWWEL